MKLSQVFASEASNLNIVLDLKEVKLVDQDAVTFLADCKRVEHTCAIVLLTSASGSGEKISFKKVLKSVLELKESQTL